MSVTALIDLSPAIVAPVAYTMQGIHAQIKNAFATSIQNYILAARVRQGQLEFDDSSPEERADIVARWKATPSGDLRAFNAMRLKQKRTSTGSSDPASPPPADDGMLSPPSRRSWFGLRRPSAEDRASLARAQTDPVVPAAVVAAAPDSPPPADAEFEQAIRASVAETSRGDPEEDRAVELAIRASVRRTGNRLPVAIRYPDVAELSASPIGPPEPVELEVSDKEYQELIQRAIEHSMAEAATAVRIQGCDGAADEEKEVVMAGENEDYERAIRASMEQGGVSGEGNDEEMLARAIRESEAAAAAADAQDEQLRRAMEESNLAAARANQEDEDLRRAMEESTKRETAIAAGENDEDLYRALAESEAAHAAANEAALAAQREEDVVLAYVKRQSLAEEEYRRRALAKGKMPEGADEEDEEMQRAMRASLATGDGKRAWGEGEGGSSRAL
jgi:hypothetical protein